MPAARDLIEPLAARLAPENPASLRPLLDRAEQAFVAVRRGTSGPPYAAMALTGRFPVSLVSTRLSLSCSWVRHESLRPYWRSRSRPLEVCAPVSGLVLAAAGEPGAMEKLLARWQAPGPGLAGFDEPGVAEFVKGAGIYALLPSPAAAAGVRGLWLAAFPQPEGLRVNALLLLSAEGNPRGLLNLVRLTLVTVLRQAGLPDLLSRLKAVELAVEGASVAMRGLTLSAQEVQALLEPLFGGPGERGGN